jgi:hypothetical protein
MTRLFFDSRSRDSSDGKKLVSHFSTAEWFSWVLSTEANFCVNPLGREVRKRFSPSGSKVIRGLIAGKDSTSYVLAGFFI